MATDSVNPDSLRPSAPTLLPCPFCGSTSVVWSDEFRRVRCNSCFMGTTSRRGEYRSDDEREQETARWNLRDAVARGAFPAGPDEATLFEQYVAFRDRRFHEGRAIFADSEANAALREFVEFVAARVPAGREADALRARIAELEAALASAPGGASGTAALRAQLQELAEAAQNYLSAEMHVGVTEDQLRALNHRLGSLAGPHLVAQQARTP